MTKQAHRHERPTSRKTGASEACNSRLIYSVNYFEMWRHAAVYVDKNVRVHGP
jgi:hypothetical protein